ncbi:hypothetical protein [Actinoplanes teichomyceticus]|nr:hypothetical protein [Actinoplanes teichomyceticus]
MAVGLPAAAYAETPSPLPSATTRSEPAPVPSTAPPAGSTPARSATSPAPSTTAAASPPASPASSAAPSGTAAPQASPARSSGTASSQATATPQATAGCGGALLKGTPVTCPEISGSAHHVYTITTTVPDERLFTTFTSTESRADARLLGVNCSFNSWIGPCTVPVPGTYRIDVSLTYGEGTAAYSIGIESRDAPSSCTTLDPATFTVNGARRPGSLPAGAGGDCYRFPGTAGMRVKVETTTAATAEGEAVDLRGTLWSPAGESVCAIQFGGGECTLTEDGTHTFFLTDMYGTASDYTVRLVRTDRPIGCGTLTPGGFGPLDAGQIARATLGSYEYTCFTVHASAGGKLVRTGDGGQIYWELDNAQGTVCEEWGVARLVCELPAAGDYTLWLRNREWVVEPVVFQAVVIDVAGTAGCDPVTGTAWDQPVHTYRPASPLEVYCRPFRAEPGERVVGYSASSGASWISDGTGTMICADSDDGQDGCALPGSGPYRVITEAGEWDEVRVQIGSLSAPAGCATVTPGSYGSAPAGPESANRCRSLVVPAAGRHLVRVVDDANYDEFSQVYDAEGRKVCQSGALCDFPAAGTYTLIVGGGTGSVREGSYATVFTTPSGSGCLPVTVQGLATGAVRGSFATPGETDCLQLDGTAGAKIGVLLPPRASGAARPDWTLIDAAGEDLCQTSRCVLTGAAPYRILLTAPEDSAAGAYALVVQRLDQVTGCATLPAGRIGSPAGVTAAFSADRFAACWTIPADEHTATEVVSFAPVTGTGYASVSVKDSTGADVCGPTLYTSATVIRCGFEAGEAYTVVMTAAPADARYRLARRDATGTNCQAPVNTVLGGAASTGTLTGPDDIRCYRVTASAAENHWIGVRSTDAFPARYWITDAEGTDRCSSYVVPCRVSGSTSYLVFVRSVVSGAVPYSVDTWNLGTADRPAAQCPAVSGVPGFRLSGTLDDTHTAVCVAVPVTGSRSSFRAVIDNTAGGEALPEPYYFATLGTGTGITRCSWASGGRGCTVSMAYPAPKTSTALFVLAPQEASGTYPYRMEAICDSDPCAEPPFAVTSDGPAGAPNSGPVNLTLRGAGVTAGDTVRLSRTGSAAITATVRGVSGDVLTATADITGAAPGAWDITVTSGTRTAALAGGLTVTAAALKLTRAPGVSGTIRVGSTVRAVVGTWSPAASGYTYQWTANGAAIKGATGAAYVIPASLRGKRIAVTVTAKRANRLNSPASSAAGTAGYGPAPKATKSPTISGTVRAGRKVKVAVGTWTPRPDTYRYEWRVDGKLVGTGSALTIKKAWSGKKLTVTVVARKAGYHDGRKTSASSRIKR